MYIVYLKIIRKLFQTLYVIYRFQIEPESGDGPGCRCKLESKCVEGCETSVFERVDMTQSKNIVIYCWHLEL